MKPDMIYIYIHWFSLMRTVHNLEDIGLAADQTKECFQDWEYSSATADCSRPVGNDAIMLLELCPMLTSAAYAKFYT